MYKCPNCENALQTNFNVCPYCGMKLNSQSKKGNIGWAILSFFIPIVGLLLFVVWHDNKNGDAKMAGIGALIGVLVSVVITISLVYLNSSMKNNARKICCTDSGGIWENETCVSPNDDHEYYIIQSYNSCLTDSGLD